LGVVAYILLTQRSPFIDSTGIVSARKLIESRTFMPPEPRTIEQGVPQKMSKTVMRLLNKNKNKRFRSAEEAIREWSK
jgi:serine/threonine protein kinase